VLQALGMVSRAGSMAVLPSAMRTAALAFSIKC
jgi:hypothetical protein